jgi:hypothetical protein
MSDIKLFRLGQPTAIANNLKKAKALIQLRFDGK